MRISVTTLESFRLWSDPEQEWMSEADLHATIKGEFTGNRKVWIGQAFGAVLEEPKRHQVAGGYRVTPRGSDGAIFLSDATMQPALDLFDRRGVFEAKASKAYGPHEVIAKADQLLGAHLIETKTTLSPFDFDKYAHSYQWRFMVDIFEPTRVTYRVFCLDEDKDGDISLKSTEEFDLYPYANLHSDCDEMVQRFVEYVDAKGLRWHLDARQTTLTGAL